MKPAQHYMGPGLAGAAVVGCLVAGWLIWQIPVHESRFDFEAREMLRWERARTLSTDGRTIVGLSIPTAIALAALWAAWRRRPIILALLTGILGLFSLVTGFSIGSAYHVSAILLFWATLAVFSEGSPEDEPVRPVPPRSPAG